MLVLRVFSAIACVGAVFGSPLGTDTTGNVTTICGNNPSKEWVIASQKDFQAKKVELPLPLNASRAAAAPIPVWFHVVTPDGRTGFVPDQQIYDQLQVMNYYYSGTGIQWALAGITRPVNSQWFYNVQYPQYTPVERQMKISLRRGGPETLNLYTVGSIGGGYLGFATFPFDEQSNPVRDGVVLLYDSLAGGSRVGYNTGRIAVHEVGHWVGLFHPFEGGCNGGDYVDDTPPQATPATVCTSRDSCPQPGLDNIHNHMDYTPDDCRTLFTRGQVERFRYMVATYRGIR